MLEISALETIHGPIYSINLVDKTKSSDNLRNNIQTGYWDSKCWYTIQVHFFFRRMSKFGAEVEHFFSNLSLKTFLIFIESCVYRISINQSQKSP